MGKNQWGGARPGAGRKPGYESEHRKTGGWRSKVARIPEHWNVLEISDGLEQLLSLIEVMQDEIHDARKRSKSGELNSRWQIVERYHRDLRRAFPRTFFEKHRWRQTGQNV